jgi:hypothetical protein
MSDTPEGTNVKLSAGSHLGSLTENCVMEKVALEYLHANGVLSTAKLLELKTDAPGCTAPWITSAAQSVNDRLGDEDRQRLSALIPRLLHDARTPADPEKRKRVAVRVSCWAARSVLHLISDEHDHETATRAIVTAEAWLRGEATEEDCRACASAATAYAYAYAYAAYAYAAAAAAYDDDYDAADDDNDEE